MSNVYTQMDGRSGMLSTRRLLDASAVGTHSLRVIARDSGKPALTATCESSRLSLCL